MVSRSAALCVESCDGDLNNDTLVNALDYLEFLNCYTLASDPMELGCDFNCDNVLNGLDFALFFSWYLPGTPPGPSGLCCAGTVPCP